MNLILGLITVILWGELSPSPPLTGSELLDKSIQYHDPHRQWGKQPLRFQVLSESPQKPSRSSQILIDLPAEHFEMAAQSGEEKVLRKITGALCANQLNGTSEIPLEVQQEKRLRCEDTQMYRDYFTYLYGLPMKLKDAGTQVDPVVKKMVFNGKEMWELTVRYDPTVGKEIWQFYFSPSTYALQGYRFFRDEQEPKGEYIILEEEAILNQMRIPTVRHWYVFPDTSFLGTDRLNRLP